MLLFYKLDNSLVVIKLGIHLVDLPQLLISLEQQVVRSGNMVMFISIKASDDIVFFVIEVKAHKLLP